MFRKKNNKSNIPAFTLVELLVVIAIIGILATLAIVSIQNTRSKARDTKRIADIKQIQTALELYFNDNGSYPVSSSVTSSIRSASRVYMEMYPQAPNPPDGDCTESNNQYVYTETGEDNGSYTLFFCLGGTNSGISSGLAVASPVGVEYGSFENLRVGLIGHWALDNIDGVVDKSTSGNDGTGVGGIVIGGAIDHKNISGGATTFDVNKNINFGEINAFKFGSNNFTVSVWARPNIAWTNWNGVLLSRWNTGGSPGSNEWNLAFGGGTASARQPTIVIESGTTSYVCSWAVDATVGVWYHVVGIREGQYLKIYVDGDLKNTTYVGNASVNSVSGRYFKIGALAVSDLYSFRGNMNNARIYNRALSEEEIQQLYSLEN